MGVAASTGSEVGPQAPVHGSREGVSSVTRRQEFPLAEPRAKQAFVHEQHFLTRYILFF